MSNPFHFHAFTSEDGTTYPMVPYPSTVEDCPQCKGVGALRPGPTEWAVRWAENGQEPKIQRYDGRDAETQAKEFHAFLRRSYNEGKLKFRPELLSAQIMWRVQA